MPPLTRSDIRRLFERLNDELETRSVKGELYMVGGAVMCLVFDARPSTNDVDAIFKPAKAIRDAAAKVGQDLGVDSTWLNDAVKGFFSEKGTFTEFLDLGNLKIFSAQPEYLLAMKCLSMRIGKEFHDEADARYLLRYLNIEGYDEALSVITRYYPLERFPQKTIYALEELFS